MPDNITPLDASRQPRPSHRQPSSTARASEDALPATGSYNFAIEQGLLGALMINNALFDRISDFLQAAHFYDPLHGRLYATLARMIQDNQPATALTLRPFFENDPELEKKGGVSYLVLLEGSASTLVNATAWARAIQSHAQRRDLITLGQDVYERAAHHDIDDPPAQQIESAESALYDIAERGVYEGGLQDFNESLRAALEMAEQAHLVSSGGGTPGVATGLHDLDEKLGTLRASDLVVIAGRPAMGKTALATNIAFNAARAWQISHRDHPDENPKGAIVGFFSLEMSAEQLSMRLLSDRAQIQAHTIRQGRIGANDLQRLDRTSQELKDLPLYIDHTGAISLQTLTARARRLKRQKGLGMIIVDYLQLVTTGVRHSHDRRVQEVSEITQGLKALAKDLNVPVIALSQLSRQVEARDDKRPQLSDLRESGAIEQDADIVLFLFREEYYHHRHPPEEGSSDFDKWQQKSEEISGLAEVIIGKHRHGPTGEVKLHFDRNYTRFSDLAPIDKIAEFRD